MPVVSPQITLLEKEALPVHNSRHGVQTVSHVQVGLSMCIMSMVLPPPLSPSRIACVVIHNYARSHGLLVFRYALNPTLAADQNVSGKAWLSVTKHQLTIKVVVHGLVPGSVHMEHIHLGTCAAQGPGGVHAEVSCCRTKPGRQRQQQSSTALLRYQRRGGISMCIEARF